MLFLIIILIIIVGLVIYGVYGGKQLQANIERRKNFVLSFLPDARIIVNDGNYLFFMDDSKQVFGVDESKKIYSYSGLHCLMDHQNSVHIGHDDISYEGLNIGKSPYPSDTSPALSASSSSAIIEAMLPILRSNLHKKLSNRNITPTHEYVNRGEIWGCDINSKFFYTTFGTIQTYSFSELVNVTTEDVSNNSNWKCNYIIEVATKRRDDGWENDFSIYVDEQTTLNNLLSMFKGIKDRQNKFDIRTDQRNFDLMEGHEFEYFCAELLKKNGYQNVSVTQGSGDQGIDIIAYRDGIKYGVQCKCYSSDIGNKAVQEVFAGKSFYECHIGVVLTNQYFTKSALELAQKNGIVLWDRNKLLDLIDNA